MTSGLFTNRPIDHILQQATEIKPGSAEMRGFFPKSLQISVPDIELGMMKNVHSLMYGNYRLVQALSMLFCSKYPRKKARIIPDYTVLVRNETSFSRAYSTRNNSWFVNW
jgi:hypothetical protein